MIAVGVGDEDHVGCQGADERGAGVATDVREPVAKDRICQHANAIHLDQRRGVSDVGDRRAAQAARMRAF